MQTINTSPMIVPTAIPAVAPGDKLGRVVVIDDKCVTVGTISPGDKLGRVVVIDGKRVTVGTISPGDKLGRTVLGGRAMARERNTSIPVSETCMWVGIYLYITYNLHVGGIAVHGEYMGRGSSRSSFDVPKSLPNDSLTSHFQSDTPCVYPTNIRH